MTKGCDSMSKQVTCTLTRPCSSHINTMRVSAFIYVCDCDICMATGDTPTTPDIMYCASSHAVHWRRSLPMVKQCGCRAMEGSQHDILPST